MSFLMIDDMYVGDCLLHLYPREEYRLKFKVIENKFCIQNYLEFYLCFDQYDENSLCFADNEDDGPIMLVFEIMGLYNEFIFRLQDGKYLSRKDERLIISDNIQYFQIINIKNFPDNEYLENNDIFERKEIEENIYLKNATENECEIVKHFIKNGIEDCIVDYYYVSKSTLIMKKFDSSLDYLKIKNNKLRLGRINYSFNFDLISYINEEIRRIINIFIENNIYDEDFCGQNFVILIRQGEFPIIRRIDLEYCLKYNTKNECKENYGENFIDEIVNNIFS